MTRHIILDSSPLGLLANPAANAEVFAISQWSRACIAAGHHLYIPEVIDYELRRELIRAGKTQSIAKLDGLKSVFHYLPITTPAMLRAAELWAYSRQQGVATGDPKKIDIDVILSAQALTMAVPAASIIIVTSNVRHIARFVPADLWTSLRP